jgi:signal transduction histidine kinase/CheY-like chemotaxis protein
VESPSRMSRLLVAISALSVAMIAVSSLLVLDDPRARAWVAVAAVLGIVILTLGTLHSMRSDRRYAELLEREVAGQTGTLMDSLGATAAAERNLRLVMEAVPDAIALVDREGRTLEMNVLAARMFGAGDVFALTIADATHTVRENLDAAFTGEVRRFEAPFLRPDQSRGISSVLCAPVREGSRISKVLVLARDITDLRLGEAQLRRAEKLGALGQLVSGVAHEINNPAAIISGFAQTLLLDDLRPEQREMVRMVHDEATRIGRITANLLAFARAGGRDRVLIDLNDIVRRTFALRSYHLSTLNIAVTLELDPAEPKVWGNGSELQQMLLNFLINAEQALVTVGTPRTVTLRTRSSEQEVTLECADSGPGIPLEIRDRIFDPFFTTKVEGEGTGLGLSICYGIAQEHGGRLAVESEPGRGATFIVTLPRDPRVFPRAPLEGPRPATPEGGPLAVLFVDDESGLRSAVARFLNRRGIQCRTAGDGAEALEVLRVHDFDVILSDVRMPGMNGQDFLLRLRADRPELVRRLVFSTGDSLDTATAALLQDTGVPWLVKPFDFTQLETLIREVAAKVSP